MSFLGKRKLSMTICSRDRALEKLRKTKYDAVISINNPSSSKVSREEVDRRAKEIRDLEPKADFFFFYDKPGRTSEKNRAAVRAAAKKIAVRARQLKEGANVLLHCARGRCRSPAAAIVMLQALNHPEKEAREIVKRIVPLANPYEELIELSK